MKLNTALKTASLLLAAVTALSVLASCSTSKPGNTASGETPEETAPAETPPAAENPDEVPEPGTPDEPETPAEGSPWQQPKRVLRFGENGEFKILVFSDVHGNGTKISALAKANIDLLVEREDPDFVFFDGDNTWGLTSEEAVRSCVTDMTEILEERHIPWAHVYGNHDAENSNLKKEIQQQIYESFDWCVSMAGEESLPGVGNYVLPVLSSKDDTVLFNIWALDSGQYVSGEERAELLPIGTIFQGFSGSVYDYIRPSQIRWYQETSEKIEAYCGRTVPGLMAFHIPLQETYAAWVNRDALEHTGEKREAVCASEINSGLFAALLERGDVKAVVNGHDHVNDYMVKYGGIRLCYCSTVSETGYCDMDMLGARVFVIREEDPADLKTYISYVDENRMKQAEADAAEAFPFESGTVLLDFEAYAPEIDSCGWDNNFSEEAEIDKIVAEFSADRGLDGSAALGVTRENFASSTYGNNAEVKIPLETPGLLGDNLYLRLWMDLTGDSARVDFRKACFGLIADNQNFSPYRTDEKDEPSPFWYLPEGGTEWKEMTHGNDGCFGQAQDSPVKGFRGWFAFPVENMLKRSSLDKLKKTSRITGVYFYFCLASDNMKGNRVYIDDITLLEDYTVFD